MSIARRELDIMREIVGAALRWRMLGKGPQKDLAEADIRIAVDKYRHNRCPMEMIEVVG